MKKTMQERFALKHSIGDGCWEWQRYCDPAGYGRFDPANERKGALAHRVSWEIHRGEVPSGMCVLHLCDNRRYVNPAHLFLGTQQDNMADMVKKDRRRKYFCKKGHALKYNARGQSRCLECQKDSYWYRKEHNEMVDQYGFGERL